MSTTQPSSAHQAATSDADRRNLIGGAWSAPANGRYLDIVNPATEALVGHLPDSGSDDVDRAVTLAAAAFDDGAGAWPSTPVAERLQILNRVLDQLAARAQEIGVAEATDGGFTVRNAVGFHAMGAPDFVRAAISSPPPDVPAGLPLTEVPTLAASFLRREPIGVVAAMPPSNGGYFLGLYKSFAALVTGNTVVLKPSPACSLGCIELAKAIAAEPEIPDDAFHLVLGDAEAGAALTAHPLVDKISFTGSVPTAKRIMAAAAPNLARLTLELGGKGPAIVCDDADLEQAVDGIVWGLLWQTGQACIAGSRLLVSHRRHDEVVARLKARFETLTVGDPMDPGTDYGPVVSAAARDRIERFIADAVSAGATIVAGGERPPFERGFWVAPTILDGVTNDMQVAREEIFGPVIAVIGYEDLDEAVRIANDTHFGLAATVWSTSNTLAMGLAKRLRAGTVWINDHHMLSPVAPFGGYKNSGIGREFGPQGLEAFTELKHIHVDLSGQERNPAWAILLGQR